MSEKDKGFRIRQLFFRDPETGTQEKQIQKIEPVSNKPQDDYFTNKTPQSTVGIQDQSLVEDFVQRLQNLINQNNQPGFDFLEFTESLFEEKQNPTPEVYKTISNEANSGTPESGTGSEQSTFGYRPEIRKPVQRYRQEGERHSQRKRPGYCEYC